MKIVSFIGIWLLILNGCSTQPDIPRYRGYSFDAAVDGVPVVELKDRTKIPALQGYVRDVKWRTVRPIRGYVDVRIMANKHTDFVGYDAYVDEVRIVPLSNNVHIKSYRALDSDSSVRFGGDAAVKEVNVMDQKRLPPGEYVMRLKIKGSNNWDRKEIYTLVR